MPEMQVFMAPIIFRYEVAADSGRFTRVVDIAVK